VLVAATVKPCGSVAGVNAQCGCAINQKVTAKAAILTSVMTISTTTHGTKTLTATASFATAGFAQGDQVTISGTNCAPLTGGNTPLVTTIASIAANGLSLVTTAAHPVQQSETTGGECKIARIASLVCEACGAGYVQAAADATPQTTARACSVLQCAGDNDVTCGCAVNQAVVNVDNDNFLECAACPTGTTFPNGDTTPQTTVRAHLRLSTPQKPPALTN
jgi:hypothetical protein